jgi:hypothetical protein
MMLQFTYKLKITERVKGKCSRHPRYNPEKDGRAGIKGACSCCFSLYDLYQARVALETAQREFIRRAAPWARQREPRRKRLSNVTGDEGSSDSDPDVGLPDHRLHIAVGNAWMGAIELL